MRANPLQGPLEGVRPENRDFLGPEMAKSEACAIWARKSRDLQVPPCPMARIMDLPPSKVGKGLCTTKKRIGTKILIIFSQKSEISFDQNSQKSFKKSRIFARTFLYHNYFRENVVLLILLHILVHVFSVQGKLFHKRK